MAFTNRIRLPLELKKPQFIQEREDYRKANGETKTLSVIIRKVYEGQTDSLPEKLHERLVIAFGHDNVSIEGDKYIGGINLEGSYDINWIDFLNRPIAQATFKANVTPFNATNSNCGTCAEYSQIIANDDNVGTLNEDTDYIFDVLDNDEICCSPVTLSLITFDSNYLTSASITVDNKISVHTSAALPDATGVQILTYRAQCQNGQYDEANVIADLDGTLPSCSAPTGLNITDITTEGATANWTQPVPSHVGFLWQLHTMPDNTIVQGAPVGEVDNVVLTGLLQNQQYRFYLRTDCGDGNYSNFIYTDFTTLTSSGSEFCGSYTINNFAPGLKLISYTDCNGNTSNFTIPPFQSRTICALQTSPGVPVNIITAIGVTIIYNGLC